jgi:hypothetical protein
MSKLINKNFEFLNQGNFSFKGKENVIFSINKIHSSISRDEYDNALGELRKIVELVLGEYLIFQGNPEDFISKLSLFKRAKYIEDQYGGQFSEQIMDAIHIVRK